MKLRYKIALAAVYAALMGGLVLACFPKARFRTIVLHHSATDHGNYATIKKAHVKRGMADAAYHLILSNGSSGIPMGHLEPTMRYKTLSHSAATRSMRANIRGLHICIVGNYEKGPVPQDLKISLGRAVGLVQEKYGIPDENVLFHRDVGKTLCPGKHITRETLFQWVEQARQNRDPIAGAQQRRVLGMPKGEPEARLTPLDIILVFSLVAMAGFLVFKNRRKKKGPEPGLQKRFPPTNLEEKNRHMGPENLFLCDSSLNAEDAKNPL